MDPVIVVGGARVFHGDCIQVLKQLPENSVDSIVTDPPYGLEFMGKDWDAPWKANGTVEQVFEGQDKSHPFRDGSSRVRYGNKDMFGFQLWATEWAVECLRVLKPGGHILAFGGSRTWHRLAVAVEDAGFELRDSIAWIYGSGFPKSLDVSKAIDKNLGVEREKIRVDASEVRNPKATGGGRDGVEGATRPWIEKALEVGFHEKDSDTPASSEAQEWQGWGTALKPAFEPVVVGRKPFGKGVTVAENVLAWGVGGLNIDGSRIAGEKGWPDTKQYSTGIAWGANKNASFTQDNSMNPAKSQGRWPANVILDEVTAGLLDEQSGVLKGKIGMTGKTGTNNSVYGHYPQNAERTEGVADAGGASRFFYVAKASKRDRNEGLEELEDGRVGAFNGNVLQADGNKIGAKPDKPNLPGKNTHPTVKPTQLMRYLIKLVTPEGGVVLDPFTGSGSTGKAALLDGFQFVGVELTEEYLPIIEGRLRWASEQVDDDDTLF
jgi:DNA modification methylase